MHLDGLVGPATLTRVLHAAGQVNRPIDTRFFPATPHTCAVTTGLRAMSPCMGAGSLVSINTPPLYPSPPLEGSPIPISLWCHSRHDHTLAPASFLIARRTAYEAPGPTTHPDPVIVWYCPAHVLPGLSSTMSLNLRTVSCQSSSTLMHVQLAKLLVLPLS